LRCSNSGDHRLNIVTVNHSAWTKRSKTSGEFMAVKKPAAKKKAAKKFKGVRREKSHVGRKKGPSAGSWGCLVCPLGQEGRIQNPPVLIRFPMNLVRPAQLVGCRGIALSGCMPTPPSIIQLGGVVRPL
jgi:hypothetical protein